MEVKPLPESWSQLKVGDDVRIYDVVSYVNNNIKVLSAIYRVEGDPAGMPLCLRLDLPGTRLSSNPVLARYGSRAVHFHEVSFSEEEAVRRHRAAKLIEAVEAEQRIVQIRAELKIPIHRANDDGKHVPVADNQVKMRVEGDLKQ